VKCQLQGCEHPRCSPVTRAALCHRAPSDGELTIETTMAPFEDNRLTAARMRGPGRADRRQPSTSIHVQKTACSPWDMATCGHGAKTPVGSLWGDNGVRPASWLGNSTAHAAPDHALRRSRALPCASQSRQVAAIASASVMDGCQPRARSLSGWRPRRVCKFNDGALRARGPQGSARARSAVGRRGG